MNRLVAAILGAALVASAPALADDLSGADRILCSIGTLVGCLEDGDCETLSPLDLNLPQFIEADLAQKKLSTTKASGENRTTPILNLARAEGRIVAQGYERGRAFSIVIHEKTGFMTAAVATDGLAVAAYGACTPLPATR